ncbi:MAG: PAS domain S-box protein, partial [Chitinophagaceae bacterium]|nr:PAS domain S-box protein [Chitinophagaceae bacterium]
MRKPSKKSNPGRVPLVARSTDRSSPDLRPDNAITDPNLSSFPFSQLNIFYGTLPQPVFVCDESLTQIVYHNSSFVQFFNEKQSHSSTSNFLTALLDQFSNKKIINALKKYPTQFQKKNDELVQVFVSSFDIKFENDGFVAFFLDVAEVTSDASPDIAEAIARNELQAFFDVARDLMCIGDTHGNFRKINAAFQDVLGYKEADILGRNIMEFVHQEDLPRTKIAFGDLLQRKHIGEFSHRIKAEDGSYKLLSWSANFSTDLELLVASARDVTERHMTAIKLLEKEARIREIFGTMSEAFIGLDDNLRYTYVNEKAVEMLGYDLNFLEG